MAKHNRLTLAFRGFLNDYTIKLKNKVFQTD
jgi:hypothetical protein